MNRCCDLLGRRPQNQTGSEQLNVARKRVPLFLKRTFRELERLEELTKNPERIKKNKSNL